MPTVLPLDEENWLQTIDALVVKWSEVTTPIFIDKQAESGKRAGEAFPLGTGFFISYRGMTFLVTAAHVIKGMDPATQFGGHTMGRAFLLGGVPFIFCHEHDLAIAPLLPDWQEKAGLKSLKVISLDSIDSTYEALGQWITMGYPKSKNGINPKLSKHAINVHGTSFTECIESPLAAAHIANPLGFRFDKKSAVNSLRQRDNPPSFKGASGSPIFQVFAKVLPGGGISLQCRLEGVLLGWYIKEKEIIAGRVEGLMLLLDEFLHHLEEVCLEGDE
ncbi:hypothetical protein QCD80_00255 [Pseudomonas syringae pv. actinidiae]|uniref:hypothetical protein n=1 Tax=Pseudomonas syringae TaxID=317 RepID=UPI00243729B5|nr:hypothetical protein [Pseudomonas syringae]MDG6431926.1 hypothetical protein [Pseudomonas syringae pv. actinidiae]